MLKLELGWDCNNKVGLILIVEMLLSRIANQ
jgi:hypothetical protein